LIVAPRGSATVCRVTSGGEKPVGESVDWTPVEPPAREELRGRTVLLRPFDPERDAEPFFRETHAPDGDPSIWTYLPDGPYESVGQMRAALAGAAESEDPLWFTIVPADGEPAGRVSYMRIDPAMGVIEIGGIFFGPRLQRTTASTEAIYLLARHAFEDLGYRRLEWKCNALNEPSRRAAARFGFTFEGIFRQHMIVKGHNRDTAWFSIVDGEWPRIAAGFEAFLAPENFDAEGRQRRPLAELIAASA
jgi:RimJ/RimL family protein N-acetyltransferase